jgi:hypothetical protein
MTICPHCRGTGVLVAIDPAAVVKAIADRIGERPFTVAELVEDEALAEALDDLTARRLGKLLRKAAGAELDGFRVERIGEECGAAIWQIVGVSGCLATTDSKKGAGDRRKKGIIARPCACPSNFC